MILPHISLMIFSFVLYESATLPDTTEHYTIVRLLYRTSRYSTDITETILYKYFPVA
jgi:hypothetical protein